MHVAALWAVAQILSVLSLPAAFAIAFAAAFTVPPFWAARGAALTSSAGERLFL